MAKTRPHKVVHLGGFGKTVFSFRHAKGIEGDRLELRQRDGVMTITAAEIRAIAGIAQALGIVAHPQTIAMVGKKVFGH